MRFQPKTEKECAAAGLFQRGIYDFEVVEAVEKTSSKGNDMVELIVQVYDKDGRSKKIYDWLVSTDGAAYKIRHFAEATGMLAQYEKGDMPASSLIGKTGHCEVIIKKDKDGQYPDKNAISDYAPPGTGTTTAAGTGNGASTTRTLEDMDSEIPF